MLRGIALAAALGVAMPARAELTPPAELPPPGYAGQQYVDSKGCLFVRAGQSPDRDVWVPRVTREGQPLCGNPPSGQRVPVVGDGANDTALPATGVTGNGETTVSGYFVAVGSFGLPANADAVVARLKALNYPAARGRLTGESGSLVTVFAGPFPDAESAVRAQSDLTGDGFAEATLIKP